MRNDLCKKLIALSKEQELFFLTGDLGFNALEPLLEVLGKHFVNAGISEQNMISVAAGMALMGLNTWVYSIAPFVYARPFEQIRNDICLNKAPVKLVGNGGGYSYGCMGSTHHALEDYGILSTLPDMHIFIPAFAADVDPIIDKMILQNSPCYLRLDRCELPKDFLLPDYAPWRCLIEGEGPLMIGVGPLTGGLINVFHSMDKSLRPEIWAVTELPLEFKKLPDKLLERIKLSKLLIIVEEHVATGSLGQALVWLLQINGISVPSLKHFYAQGYPSSTYGSQSFHRKQSGIDALSIQKLLFT